VCLVEGATACVKLESAARALHHKPSKHELLQQWHESHKDHENSESTLRELLLGIRNSIRPIIPLVLQPLKCAEELFAVGSQGDKETTRRTLFSEEDEVAQAEEDTFPEECSDEDFPAQ